jgi:ubiquinone/menaquinone biosynthesis C-methylase UbiE
MARETAAENTRALQLLDIRDGDAVLEIGSGHGDTLARAAVFTAGPLHGVDHSQVMHVGAIRRHRRLVSEGALEFRLGSSDNLPHADASFDKAYSVHTVYFWGEPLDHLREAHRVLRANGRILLGFRPAEDEGFAAAFPGEVYAIRRRSEVVQLMQASGFDIIQEANETFGSRQITFLLASKA